MSTSFYFIILFEFFFLDEIYFLPDIFSTTLYRIISRKKNLFKKEKKKKIVHNLLWKEKKPKNFVYVKNSIFYANYFIVPTPYTNKFYYNLYTSPFHSVNPLFVYLSFTAWKICLTNNKGNIWWAMLVTVHQTLFSPFKIICQFFLFICIEKYIHPILGKKDTREKTSIVILDIIYI